MSADTDDTAEKAVYITVYTNQWPDDGFEVGDVYTSEERAEQIAEEQSDIEHGWEYGHVYERQLIGGVSDE